MGGEKNDTNDTYPCRRSKSFLPMHQARLELAGCFEEMFLEHRQAKISFQSSHFY